MKINYLTLTFGLMTLLVLGCKEDEISLNEKEVLLSGTWIKHSYYISGVSNGFEEYFFKDEYTFFDNGKYKLKGIRTFYNDQNELIQNTIEYELDWHFNDVNKIIDFKINDTSEIVMQFDWKIIELSENRIIVIDIWPSETQIDIDSRNLLKRKN